jgi:cytidine deaminase
MTTAEDLVKAALDVAHRAYAPYSKFFVGACIKTTSGQLFIGCNVENASYGATLCAEASAIATMVSHGEQHIAEIAIAGLHCNQTIIPCGICLQRIREFSKPSTTLLHLANPQGKFVTYTLEQLQPYSFGPEFLETAK